MALDGDTKKDSESSEPSLVDRLKGTELYVVDGVAQAFQPLNDKINPAKLVHDAKPFKQSVTLSQLRKILKNKPDYFK